MALGWYCLVVSQLQAHPAHGGGLGTHFLQPRQLSPCVCSKSGLSNCVAVGTSMASGLPSCSEWQLPSPLLTEQEDTAFAAISNWMGQHPPQTHHEGVARQFLPETLSLWAHPIRVFCFLPLHAHLAFQIQLCPEGDNLTHPSHSWGTTPAACSAFKIQIICSHSIRRV